jgi:hypothetical protein
VRSACLDWDLAGPIAEDASLVTTELVTNAVLRAGTSCRLTLALDDRGLRIAVRDRGRGHVPPLRPIGDAGAPSGSGLHVVAAMSTAWGVSHTDGKSMPDHHREHHDRQVHKEQPAPARDLEQQPGEQRAEHEQGCAARGELVRSTRSSGCRADGPVSDPTSRRALPVLGRWSWLQRPVQPIQVVGQAVQPSPHVDHQQGIRR